MKFGFGCCCCDAVLSRRIVKVEGSTGNVLWSKGYSTLYDTGDSHSGHNLCADVRSTRWDETSQQIWFALFDAGVSSVSKLVAIDKAGDIQFSVLDLAASVGNGDPSGNLRVGRSIDVNGDGTFACMIDNGITAGTFVTTVNSGSGTYVPSADGELTIEGWAGGSGGGSGDIGGGSAAGKGGGTGGYFKITRAVTTAHSFSHSVGTGGAGSTVGNPADGQAGTNTTVSGTTTPGAISCAANAGTGGGSLGGGAVGTAGNATGGDTSSPGTAGTTNSGNTGGAGGTAPGVGGGTGGAGGLNGFNGSNGNAPGGAGGGAGKNGNGGAGAAGRLKYTLVVSAIRVRTFDDTGATVSEFTPTLTSGSYAPINSADNAPNLWVTASGYVVESINRFPQLYTTGGTKVWDQSTAAGFFNIVGNDATRLVFATGVRVTTATGAATTPLVGSPTSTRNALPAGPGCVALTIRPGTPTQTEFYDLNAGSVVITVPNHYPNTGGAAAVFYLDLDNSVAYIAHNSGSGAVLDQYDASGTLVWSTVIGNAAGPLVGTKILNLVVDDDGNVYASL